MRFVWASVWWNDFPELHETTHLMRLHTRRLWCKLWVEAILMAHPDLTVVIHLIQLATLTNSDEDFSHVTFGSSSSWIFSCSVNMDYWRLNPSKLRHSELSWAFAQVTLEISVPVCQRISLLVDKRESGLVKSKCWWYYDLRGSLDWESKKAERRYQLQWSSVFHGSNQIAET